jgi:hypothetical protein
MDKCKKSFQGLKKRLITALVLALPTGSDNFVVYSNKGFRVRAYAERQCYRNTPIKTNLFTKQILFHMGNQQRFSIIVF